MSDHTTARTTARLPQQGLLEPRWYSFGSPVGLGLGLMSVGAFFALFTLGLAALASIRY